VTHVEPATANGRELDVLWPAILDSLAPNQRVWLASSRPVMLAESTAVIAVPNEFTRTQLEGRLRTRLEDALSDSLNKPIRIAVTVDDTLAPPAGGPESHRDAIAESDPATGADTSAHDSVGMPGTDNGRLARQRLTAPRHAMNRLVHKAICRQTSRWVRRR
jgi:chromosomal replication initiation ATPase DnaA